CGRSSSGHDLILGYAVDFSEAGDAVLYLEQGGLTQVANSGVGRRMCDLQRAAAVKDDVGDRFGDGHYLIDAGPALVAVVAAGAADSVVEDDSCIDFILRETLR